MHNISLSYVGFARLNHQEEVQGTGSLEIALTTHYQKNFNCMHYTRMGKRGPPYTCCRINPIMPEFTQMSNYYEMNIFPFFAGLDKDCYPKSWQKEVWQLPELDEPGLQLRRQL